MPIQFRVLLLPTLLAACALPAFAAPTYLGSIPTAASPFRIAVASDGNILVSEPVLNQVQEFTPAGVLVRSFGSGGFGPGQFNETGGIAFTPSGNVLVTDYGGSRVEEFTRTGSYVREFGNGQLSAPGGLAQNAQGSVLVASWGGITSLKLFSPTGLLLKTLAPKPGAPGYQFMDVDIAPDGTIYVVNGFGSMWIYTSAGDFVSEFSSFGQGPGQLSQPEGVGIGPTGHVYVADTANNRIQEFTSTGSLFATWGSPGTGPGQFSAPTDVVATSSGLIYVDDKFNQRIDVFFDATTPAPMTTWGAVKALYRGPTQP